MQTPEQTNEELVQSIIEQVPDDIEAIDAEEAEIGQNEPLKKEILKLKPDSVLKNKTPEEIEELAKEWGWNPDYTGENKKTAQEFVEFAERVPRKALDARNKLQQQVQVLSKTVETLMSDNAAALKRQAEQYEERLKAIEAKKAEARENLDTDALEKAINEETKLKQEKSDIDRRANDRPIPPDVQMWGEENKAWLDDNAIATYANAITPQIRTQYPNLSPIQILDKVKERVILDLPEKMAKYASTSYNNNQQQAPRMDTVTRTKTPEKPAPNKLTISTLPKDVKDGYDIIVKNIRFKTPDEKKAYDEMFLQHYLANKGEKTSA